MLISEPSIDISRLEKVRRLPCGDIISRCPACAEAGKDNKCDNLRIFASGAFHCIVHPKDKEHNQRIFALVGIKGEFQRDPERDRQWRAEKNAERLASQKKAELTQTARAHRATIAARYAWTEADVWEDSPQRIDCDLVASDPRHFLASLFPRDAVAWAGETSHSGAHPMAAHSWKTVSDWQAVAPQLIGPMTTPATWPKGCQSRAAANVISSPYVVLDFDGLDGIHPKTPPEIEAHLAAARALVRWLREEMHWKLAAILHTGNKSLHAWFHTPSPEVLSSLLPIASSLGIDAGLIGRPEHPCRLPGHQHAKTGEFSRVLWLQSPADTPPPP